jgi:hypothetical protein
MSDEASASPATSEPAVSGAQAGGPEGKSGNGVPAKDQDQATDLLGGEGRGFNEALGQGQRFLSPEMSRYGPSAAIGRADIREMQVGDRTQIFIGHTVSRTPGAVREDVLAWIRERYLDVTGHRQMLETLRSRRVVLLRGQPGTGRVTTALHLLDTLVPDRIFRLDSGVTIRSLTETGLPEKNAGYVAELSRRIGSSLNEAHLDKLNRILADNSAFCVLVSETDPRPTDAFGGYAFAYAAPEPRQLLKKHASHEVLPTDALGFDARLDELVDAPWVTAALGPCPRPVESVRMAALLAKHARDEITQEDVERDAAQAVYFQITEWLAATQAAPQGEERDEALRLAAFRIALAVLNESPYHMVAEAAGQLATRFIDAGGGSEKRRTSLFSDDQEGRLPALRAKVIDGHTPFGDARVPMPLLVFHDDRYPSAILKYVWENHHHMRGAIARWLSKLSKDPRPQVWVRAAQATGYLCGLDFVYVFTKMIFPGASAAGSKRGRRLRRLSAAIALDQAAQNDHLRPAIRDRLRYWRRNGSPAQRWTAAAAYGFTLGRRYIDESLEELRILGTPAERRHPMVDGDDHALRSRAGWSVAKLLAFGQVGPVLDRLRQWIHSDRSSLRRLALSALDSLIDFYGFELDYLSISAGGGKPVLPVAAERWPLLLTLQWQDPCLTEPIAYLLRHSLRARGGDQIAKQFLGKWIRAGERDAECLDVLERFLPHIVEQDGDARRLRHLVGRMRTDWAEPLGEDVAERLDLAIAVANVGSAVS